MFSLIGLSIEGLTSFSVAPLRLASLLGLLLAGAALIFGVQILIETFVYGQSVPGYPSVVVGLMVLGGVQLIMIGIIGEYIGKILSELKARPVYFVAEHSLKTADDADRARTRRRDRRPSRRRRRDVGRVCRRQRRACRARAPRRSGCAPTTTASRPVNAAIRDLIGRGRINATSVMVVAPSFHRSEAAALDALRAHGARAAIGLHLTLDGAVPAADRRIRAAARRRVSLATPRCWARLPASARTARRSKPRSRRRSGCSRTTSAARPISSTAISTFTFSRRCATRCSRSPEDGAGRLAPAMRPRRLARGAASAIRKGFVLDLLSSASARARRRSACSTNPAFAGTYEFNDDADFAALFPRFLEGLPDGGLVMCHPGLVDAELRRLDPLTTLREQEYAYFSGEAFPTLLASQGITLA